ncbi:acyltransferase [Mesorhizobium sp. M7A.F.Ca.CA.001.09.2.1]|nr:acyltransferase [Mesorhizobium sp. M7A.F.Ca.CA.001.13.2.1]RUY68194.1 acyltransferase [Mesorhizobium sp. M7A.F.Ca.CA.001.13.1.1]RUY74251.1 acyltransferase [Mesorhizobium sp. M7A.F.Ca.CA.001.05.1.1]RUY75817.1 acyltransferase [Mesorhizobium sp. M7A.F.Ca.CA.001.09.2.1]RUZ09117.1 acyltransferase [Mesorhizobium sp. M7A.F.Ca.CA.001.04.2.1]RUZ24983.1 acyltransferase [Mesorhizobium sp. M7A.F.Ca.CA.001.09.1.1]RUZ36505.1 acyltransferase [Mesorhizobium sp. M7A.F.Ca.CA.001.04.1.1]RUZ42395.1 acyltransf
MRDLVGNKVYSRGEAYWRDGLVQLLTVGSKRVLAQVAGTEDYRVELMGPAESIEGSCSCRAFGDWGYCKHLVAAALATNAAGSDGEAEGAGMFARIREHLEGKDKTALVEMIVDIAERDPILLRKLEMATLATQSGDEVTLEARLGKMIDGATATNGFVDYREAPDWAQGVKEALDAIAALPSKHADIMLKLAIQVIDQVEAALENIDDSDGHCAPLLDRACEIHLQAAQVAPCVSVSLARDLFEREINGDYDTFSGAAGRYSDVLGEDGLAEYRRLATEAWEELPATAGKSRTGHILNGDHYRLREILDFFAERDGDVEARIALRAKHLSSLEAYLQIAKLCLSYGRADEALRWAEDGLWLFEDDRPDERLVFFAVELLTTAGRDADAEAHLWRAFEKAPSLELYRRLCKTGGVAARDRAVSRLQSRLAGEKSSKWHYPAELLIGILIEEKRFDLAWANTREHGASDGLKERLARASEATHPREALTIYAERVNRLAEFGGNDAYAEAAALIGHMAGLRGASEHAAYLADVKTRFGRKRNFMKLLA